MFWLGTAASVLAIVAIAIALMGLPLAPLLAVVHGFSRAAGVAAVHLLRPWGPISDSLHHGADIVSWVAVLAEIAGALTLGLAGAYALRLREQNGVARDVPGIPTLVE